MSVGFYVWPIKNWNDFETVAKGLDLQRANSSKLRKPDDFLRDLYVKGAPEIADISFESWGVCRWFLDQLGKTASAKGPDTQKLFREVFLNPLTSKTTDTQIATGISEEWDAVCSTISPSRVKELHKKSLEFDWESLRAFYIPEPPEPTLSSMTGFKRLGAFYVPEPPEPPDKIDDLDEPYDGFEDILENGQSWQHLLRDAAKYNLGLIILQY